MGQQSWPGKPPGNRAASSLLKFAYGLSDFAV